MSMHSGPPHPSVPDQPLTQDPDGQPQGDGPLEISTNTELALPDPDDVPTLVDRVATKRRSEHARFLSRKGFVSHDQACSECDEGRLWTKDNEVICANCYVVYDEEDRRRADSVDPWKEFWRTRGKYRSGKTKLVGGYGSSYSWVTRDDLEGEQLIADIDPGEFYA